MRLSKRTVLTSAAVMIAGPAMAGAIAVGQRLEVEVDAKKIEQEGNDIWAKIGGWCAIKDWHPAVANCEESKEGDATFRTLTLKDGGKIKEKQTGKTARGYSYDIIESPLPVKNYSAQFSVTPDDDDEDELNVVWAATFDANGKPDKEAKGVIDGIFKDGIASIKEKLAKK